jgi:hypothetical protein
MVVDNVVRVQSVNHSHDRPTNFLLMDAPCFWRSAVR